MYQKILDGSIPFVNSNNEVCSLIGKTSFEQDCAQIEYNVSHINRIIDNDVGSIPTTLPNK